MRRSVSGASLALLLAACLVSWPAPAGAEPSASSERMRREKARLTEMKRRAERTAAELSEAMGREKVARRERDRLRSRLSRQRRLVTGIDQKLARLESELAREEALARSLEAKKGEKGRRIASAAYNAFVMSRDGRAGLLGELSGERLRHFTRRLLERELSTYGKLSEDKEAVEEKLNGIERRLEASERRKAREEGFRETLASRQEAQARKVAEIARERRRKERELGLLKGRIARMEALVAEVERKGREKERREGKGAIRPAAKFSAVPGGLLPPLAGRVVSRFGRSRDPVFDVELENRGVEIEAPAGSPFRAVGRGEVVFTGSVPGFGNVLILQHGSGLYSVYGRAGSFSAKEGRRVAAGETIGRLPASPGGKSMLYLELRAAGGAIDPQSVIAFPR